MTLSAELLAEVIAAFQMPIGLDPAHDKRRVRRVECSAQVLIVPAGTDRSRPIRAEARDLSPRGIRIMHRSPLKVGEQFVLMLPRASGRPLPILCNVAHCRACPGATFSIGAEFVCQLPGEPPAGQASDKAELDRIRQSVLS